MAHIEDRWKHGANRARLRWRARYTGPDGREHARSFARKTDAARWLADQEATKVTGTWIDPRRGRLRFGEWAEQWWQVWSTAPGRSPNTLQSTEPRLRLSVRPYFDGLQLQAITTQTVTRWQQELQRTLGHEALMSCRSILHRILQAALVDRLIAFNPLLEVPAPSRPVDPDALFGRARPRVLTPDQLGHLLAAATGGHRDHFLILAGTGLRAGELCGMHVRRVDLADDHLEVVDTRYEAGRFGTGYKDRPKSVAGIRRIPLAPLVRAAVAQQLPDDRDPEALTFTGPGGGNSVPRGVRTPVSMNNLRRAYRSALAYAREHGQLTALDLHGPHDLRHTYATWLEDAGIPARVIDEPWATSRPTRRGPAGAASVGTTATPPRRWPTASAAP